MFFQLHRLTFWNRHSTDVRIEITKKQTTNNNIVDTGIGQVNVAFESGENNSNADKENNDASVKIVTQEPLQLYKESETAEQTGE